VEEALARDQWSEDRWHGWQQEQLARLLDRAARKVPYYRGWWEERRRRGDRSSWERIENWPVLEKETIRRRPLELVAEDCDPRRMYQEHTSGTTGTPLRLWIGRETLHRWYALFEARCRRWHGLTRHDRWAILGGQLVTPIEVRRPPFWVWNRAFHQLYLSSYHLAPDLIPSYLEALEKYRIRYLLGYTSALNSLAQAALRLGWKGTPMRVAITNAEPVFPYQRRAIAEAFGCPMQETYGMSEIAGAAGQCEHGTMHIWPDAGYIEILEGQAPASRGTAGDLVVTGLLNTGMPLIRYRVGDRASLPPRSGACACGRGLPVLGPLEGRSDDVLYSTDGRQVGRLDPLFKGDLPILEAQIIQESARRVRMLYVPAPGFAPETSDELRRLLAERLGPMEFQLTAVETIPRGSNGKFRAVVNLTRNHHS
jgi:phenylacetate-CoA ligase